MSDKNQIDVFLIDLLGSTRKVILKADHLKAIEAERRTIDHQKEIVSEQAKYIQALKDEVERLKDALETENNFSTGNYQMYKIAKSMLSENQVKNLHEKLGADRC